VDWYLQSEHKQPGSALGVNRRTTTLYNPIQTLNSYDPL